VSVSDWFKRLFSNHSDSDEEHDALREEGLGGASAGEADVKYMGETGGGGGDTEIRYGAMDAAEAVEDDLASEEAPPDLDP
jgi:hypothetical protein